MKDKIEKHLIEDLGYTEEEVAKLSIVENTVGSVETVMEEQGMSEEAAINFVLFGVV